MHSIEQQNNSFFTESARQNQNIETQGGIDEKHEHAL